MVPGFMAREDRSDTPDSKTIPAPRSNRAARRRICRTQSAQAFPLMLILKIM